MVMLNFDANAVEPQKAIGAIPEGDYKVAITKSENKPTKAGTGSYLQLKLQVLEGEYKGRFLWSRLNMDNPNSQAVEIAKSELSAICHATGVLTPQDSVELHNKPMFVSVKVRKRQDNGELSNEIKGYKSLSENTAAVAATNGEAPW